MVAAEVAVGNELSVHCFDAQGIGVGLVELAVDLPVRPLGGEHALQAGGRGPVVVARLHDDRERLASLASLVGGDLHQ